MTSTFGTPRSWWADEPGRKEFEVSAMRVAAPDLVWLAEDDEPSGGWQGPVPVWPFERSEPAELSRLAPTPLEVRIVCGHAYPMVEPRIYPLNVQLPTIALGWTTWHVAPDGSLCMLQESAAWDPRCPAADLVPKVSGWYLEYHLLRLGRIDAMTESGIVTNHDLDETLTEAARAPQ